MKVFLLPPQENWICDRIVKEWHDYMPSISTWSVQEADILWLQAGWCWNHLDQDTLQRKKVVLTEHHIVPEKFGPDEKKVFEYRDHFVDAYHVPNDFTKNFIRSMTQKPIHVIGYWYDPRVWFSEDKSECRKTLGLEENAFIVGSFQRDTEGGNSGKPKLEKGPDLFCDYLERMNRGDLHVLLGGWRREFVIERLKMSNISYTFLEKVDLETVRKMYNACDLYAVTSRYEGGPQALYEAAACKVPIISSNVGTASQVLAQNCIINVQKDLYYPTESDVADTFNNVQQFNIVTHAKNYEKMLREVLQGE